ncbi:hypothetical protein PLICBS_007683 [Purpureocillium lilacinum]|uniref:uncharacterized protein n=1 Tax=Purpureocillium lilacinum TaxID=33203 RepID=UPI00207E30B6|nr:hypothetical protein PLICBS_007683 [Purpureocillium lilacinum]
MKAAALICVTGSVAVALPGPSTAGRGVQPASENERRSTLKPFVPKMRVILPLCFPKDRRARPTNEDCGTALYCHYWEVKKDSDLFWERKYPDEAACLRDHETEAEHKKKKLARGPLLAWQKGSLPAWQEGRQPVEECSVNHVDEGACGTEAYCLSYNRKPVPDNKYRNAYDCFEAHDDPPTTANPPKQNAKPTEERPATPSSSKELLGWAAPPSKKPFPELDGCTAKELAPLSLAEQAARCGTGNICRNMGGFDGNSQASRECFDKFVDPPTRPKSILPYKIGTFNPNGARQTQDCVDYSSSEDKCGTAKTCSLYNNLMEHDDMYRSEADCLAAHGPKRLWPFVKAPAKSPEGCSRLLATDVRFPDTANRCGTDLACEAMVGRPGQRFDNEDDCYAAFEPRQEEKPKELKDYKVGTATGSELAFECNDFGLDQDKCGTARYCRLFSLRKSDLYKSNRDCLDHHKPPPADASR